MAEPLGQQTGRQPAVAEPGRQQTSRQQAATEPSRQPAMAEPGRKQAMAELGREQAGAERSCQQAATEPGRRLAAEPGRPAAGAEQGRQRAEVDGSGEDRSDEVIKVDETGKGAALREQVLGELRRIASEELEYADPIEPGQRLQQDLGLDSMGRLVVAVGLENRFRIKLDEQDAGELVTVSDLLELVERRIGEQGGAGAGSAAAPGAGAGQPVVEGDQGRQGAADGGAAEASRTSAENGAPRRGAGETEGGR